MKIIFVAIILFNIYYTCQAKTAALTHYNSYAACCKNNPNYDPKADKEECSDYSACKYSGLFAAFDEKKSFEWVKSHDLVAFYDASDKQGKNFQKKYAGKKIRLTKNGKTFEALIADTCSDKDCDGCCTRNSKNGFLVDVEHFTAVRRFGSADKASGTIEFEILN